MKRLWFVLIAGCAAVPPPVTALDAARAHVDLADLQHGRSLLLSKCGRCHDTPVPAELAARDWPAKLDDMAVRAGIDRAQRQLIEQYLLTMSSH